MAKKRNAKGRFVATRAKRKSNPDVPVPLLGNPRRRRRVRRKSNPAVLMGIGNPPPMTDLVEFILPGFAGYAATKFVSRVTYAQLSKKFPKAGKHLAAGSTIASFLTAWLLVHRIKRLQHYHTPVVVGSAIASLQTLVRLYLPKYGWIVADVPMDDSQTLSAATSAEVERLFPGGPEVVSDGAEAEGDDDGVDDLDLGSLGSLGSGGGLGADDLSN